MSDRIRERTKDCCKWAILPLFVVYSYVYLFLSESVRYEGHYFRFINKRTLRVNCPVGLFAPLVWIESHIRCEYTSLGTQNSDATIGHGSISAWIPPEERPGEAEIQRFRRLLYSGAIRTQKPKPDLDAAVVSDGDAASPAS